MRVFVFGIDGLTINVMRPLMEKGIIPNFRSIYDSETSAVLKGTVPPLTPPGWASIYTGKNQGKHGLFEFKRREGLLFRTNTCWDYTEAPPVWKYLSDSGKRSVLLNVPMYYPPLRIDNCTSVSGFNAIETMDIYHPRGLKQELLSRVPGYRLDSVMIDDVLEDKKDEFIRDNIEIIEARIDALCYLMESREWDFFFTVFTGADRIQHFYWDDIMNFNADVIKYYELLDGAIGRVLDSLDDDDFFLVVSDHGFCSLCNRNININSVLQRNGFLSLKKSVELPFNYVKIQKFFERLRITNKLRKRIPKKLIYKLQKHTKVEGAFSFSKIDWDDTKAFASSGNFGGIYLNMIGREPFGVVSEDDYDSLREAVIEIFLSLRDDENGGEQVIEKAYKREDLFHGKNLDKMPDIVLLAKEGYKFDEALDRDSIFAEPRTIEGRAQLTGEHAVDSIFLMKHGGYKKRLDDVSVNDIAPTIMNIFGLPIPSSMDGRSVVDDNLDPLYLDELTGSVYKKSAAKKLDVRSKLKDLGL